MRERRADRSLVCTLDVIGFGPGQGRERDEEEKRGGRMAANRKPPPTYHMHVYVLPRQLVHYLQPLGLGERQLAQRKSERGHPLRGEVLCRRALNMPLDL